MKYILSIIIAFYLIGCAPPGTYINPIVVDSTIEKPSDIKIAILNTSVIGNPDLITNPSTADQFAMDLKSIGFRVIDRTFVESWLLENNIDINQEITVSIMKKMQSDLGAQALPL